MTLHIPGNRREWLTANASAIDEIGDAAFDYLVQRLTDLSGIATPDGAREFAAEAAKAVGTSTDLMRLLAAWMVEISSLALQDPRETIAEDIIREAYSDPASSDAVRERVRRVVEVTLTGTSVKRAMADRDNLVGVLPFFMGMRSTVGLRAAFTTPSGEVTNNSDEDTEFRGFVPIASVQIEADSVPVFSFQIDRTSVTRLVRQLTSTLEKMDQLDAMARNLEKKS